MQGSVFKTFGEPEELSETVQEVRIAAVNAWAITTFNCRLDECGIWLSDNEALEVVETLGSKFSSIYIIFLLG